MSPIKMLLIFTWVTGIFVASAIADPASPPKMKQYYFVMLKKGPNRANDEAGAKKIQEGHMAHIEATAKSGKLTVAGPFGDEGEWRGILIYDVATEAEAKALCDADPAVKAGRLVCEIHPWWTQTGATFK
jgi:uncharacterized protein